MDRHCFAIFLVLIFLASNTFAGCGTTARDVADDKDWKTHNSEANFFTIQYPSSWSVMEALWRCFIESPDGKASVSIERLHAEARLSVCVERDIEERKQEYYYYELLSNDETTHQNKQAQLVNTILQKQPNDPSQRSKTLFVILSGNVMYKVHCSAPESTYGKYSSIFERMLTSFHGN